jgi:hypothetical protein
VFSSFPRSAISVLWITNRSLRLDEVERILGSSGSHKLVRSVEKIHHLIKDNTVTISSSDSTVPVTEIGLKG